MAKLTIADALKIHVNANSIITQNQQDEFETLLAQMEDIVIVSPAFSLAVDKSLPSSHAKTIYQANMTLREDISLSEYFIISQISANAFGLASSIAGIYILKNPARRVGGKLQRSSEMPEFGSKQKNQAKSLQYYFETLQNDEKGFTIMLKAFENALDTAFITGGDEALRSMHWHACNEACISMFSDEDGNGYRLHKNVNQVNAAVEGLLSNIVKACNTYAREIALMVDNDPQRCKQIEGIINMPLESTYKGEVLIKEGVDQILEYNIKAVSDILEGWELSEIEEQGKEEIKSTERSESDYDSDVI